MIVGCPECGKKNRIRLDRLPETGHCGSCQTVFGPLAVPIDVDARGFDQVLQSSSVPVLVDFWAPWCGPCKRAAPEVARAAQLLKGKALVLKVDTEKNPEIAQRYNISGIPYFAVFKFGHKTRDQTGLANAQQLVALVGR
jgi:thioredoxin 2